MLKTPLNHLGKLFEGDFFGHSSRFSRLRETVKQGGVLLQGKRILNSLINKIRHLQIWLGPSSAMSYR